MKRAFVLLLGIFTIAMCVVALFARFLGGVFLSLASEQVAGSPSPSATALILVFAFSLLGLLAGYVIYALASPRLSPREKIWWTLGFIFCGVFAMPSFWYWHLWRRPEVPELPLEVAREGATSGKFRIKRTDAEWFAIDYDRSAEILKPLVIPSRLLVPGAKPRFEADGAQFIAEHKTDGVHVFFYKSNLPPEREMEIARDILANIEHQTGAKGEAVAC